MKYENGIIALDSKYDSTNADKFKEELMKCILDNADEISKSGAVTLDANNTEYVSSAGLRVFLHVKKQGYNLKIINVSSEVYDIFDMTGFNKIFQINKKIKEMDFLEAWEEIGHGASSKVYRIASDLLLKVYDKKIPLWKIEREANNVKNAIVHGIPTYIGFEIVNLKGIDYGNYGLVIELLDSEVFSSFLNKNPELFDEYASKYLDMIRSIHNTEADDGFEDIEKLWHSWVDMLSPWLSDAELEKLHYMVSIVPKRHTIVHSDMHVNNVIVSNNELVIIDMADIGYGHPIFDIGPLCFHYHYMELASKEMADNLIIANHDVRTKLWKRLMDEYLADENPKRHEALVKIYNCFGAMRCGIIAAKHAQLPIESKNMFISTMKKELFPQYDEIISLMKEYL